MRFNERGMHNARHTGEYVLTRSMLDRNESYVIRVESLMSRVACYRAQLRSRRGPETRIGRRRGDSDPYT